MANELAVVENQFKALMPQYAQVLAGRMEPERLVRTVLVSCEKTPRLLACTRQSLLNSAMTAAVLAIEVDGVTGQGYLVPYKLKGVLTAQFQLGYKGMNTLGARSGFSINAMVVREGDPFDYDFGTTPFIHHKPKLDSSGRIIAAWSTATSKYLAPLFSLLPIADIQAIKAKSKAADGEGGFSPWDDPKVGFPAMAEKTARRRLSRSMPLNAQTMDYHLAARLDETVEERGLGGRTWLRPDGALMIDGTESPIAQREPSDTPKLEDLKGQAPDPELEKLKADGLEAAKKGTAAANSWWIRRTERQMHALKEWKESHLKPEAKKHDVQDGDFTDN